MLLVEFKEQHPEVVEFEIYKDGNLYIDNGQFDYWDIDAVTYSTYDIGTVCTVYL